MKTQTFHSIRNPKWIVENTTIWPQFSKIRSEGYIAIFFLVFAACPDHLLIANDDNHDDEIEIA